MIFLTRILLTAALGGLVLFGHASLALAGGRQSLHLVSSTTPVAGQAEYNRDDAGPHDNEEAQRNAIRLRAAALLKDGDFTALDSVAARYRQSRERTSAGDWKLNQLYVGVRRSVPEDPNAPEWKLLDQTSRQWLVDHPDSPTAVVVRAKLLDEHAWTYRANRHAIQSKSEDLKTYLELIEQARDVLDSHPEANVDPEWDAIRLDIAKQQGADSEAILKRAAEALGRECCYYTIHLMATDALLPKWGGSETAIKRYVGLALNRSEVQEGTQVYARIYLYLSRDESSAPVDTLNLTGAKWPAMRQSLDEILRAYPDPFNVDTARAMACLGGDKAYYVSLGRRTDPASPQVAWWDVRDFRDSCDAWAFEGKVYHGPLPELLHGYSSFLRGFGDELWQPVSLAVVVMSIGLELLLGLMRTLSRGRSSPARFGTDRPAFDPSLYPRTYRQLSGNRWIGIPMAVRLLVLGATVEWAFNTVPESGRAEEVIARIACALTALLGASIILAQFRRRVVLRGDSIELHGMLRSHRLERHQIAGYRVRQVGSRAEALVLIPYDPLRKSLEVGTVAAADQAYREWFASLRLLDPAQPRQV